MEEVSVSKLQREMRLGYNKAAKIIERMEREGVVGPPNGVKPRQVLIRPIGEVSSIPNI
jgi:S-DNA-T family DNA segregation ATPase FtsK/SpoIIIE